jgi:hypothetical protein
MTRIMNAGGFRALHKSQPGKWPESIAEEYPLVWITRDDHPTVCSNLKNGHATSVAEAEGFLVESRRLLVQNAHLHPLTVFVHYRDVVDDVDGVIARVAERLGVE